MTAPAKYRQFPSRLKYEKDGEKTDPSDVTGEKRWEEKILSLQSLSRLESQWQSPEEKEAEKGKSSALLFLTHPLNLAEYSPWIFDVYRLSPCLFNLYAEYMMRNAGLDEAQDGIKTAGRNINNLRYTNGTTVMAESEEELKSLLMKVKKESEKLA